MNRWEKCVISKLQYTLSKKENFWFWIDCYAVVSIKYLIVAFAYDNCFDKRKVVVKWNLINTILFEIAHALSSSQYNSQSLRLEFVSR